MAQAGILAGAAALFNAQQAYGQEIDQPAREAASQRQETEFRLENARTLDAHLGGMERAIRAVRERLEANGDVETGRAFAQIDRGVTAAREVAEARARGSFPGIDQGTLTEADRGYEAVMGITRDRRRSADTMIAVIGELDANHLNAREARALSRATLAAEAENYQPPASEDRPEARYRTLDLRECLSAQQIRLLASYIDRQAPDASHPERASGLSVRENGAIPYPDMIRLYRTISSTGGLDKNVWGRLYNAISPANPNLTPEAFDALTAQVEMRLALLVIDDGERMEQAQRRQRAENAARSAPADEGQAARPSSQPNLMQARIDADAPGTTHHHRHRQHH